MYWTREIGRHACINLYRRLPIIETPIQTANSRNLLWGCEVQWDWPDGDTRHSSYRKSHRITASNVHGTFGKTDK